MPTQLIPIQQDKKGKFIQATIKIEIDVYLNEHDERKEIFINEATRLVMDKLAWDLMTTSPFKMVQEIQPQQIDFPI